MPGQSVCRLNDRCEALRISAPNRVIQANFHSITRVAMHLFRTPWLSATTSARVSEARHTTLARQARRLALLEHVDAIPDAPLALQIWVLQRMEQHDTQSREAKAA